MVHGPKIFVDRPEVIEDFPSITYKITSNVPIYGLEKVVLKQDVEVTIDIWTDTPKEGDDILVLLVASMLTGNYLLIFSSDMIEAGEGDAKAISHITTRFKF